MQKGTVDNNLEEAGWGSAQRGPGVANYVMDSGVSSRHVMSRVTVVVSRLRAQADPVLLLTGFVTSSS